MNLNLSEVSDTELLLSIDKTRDTGFYQFLVGGTKENPTFLLIVRQGLGYSEPPEIMGPLADYNLLAIEIFYWQKDPPAQEAKVWTCNKLWSISNDINITWHLFPHICVNPNTDENFMAQPWAKEFHKIRDLVGYGAGYGALVSPQVLCQIVRYCHSIGNLKAFW